MKWLSSIVAPFALVSVLETQAAAEASFEFSYTGRLVDAASGRPVEGPITLSISFFHLASGGVSVMTVSEGLEMVPLEEGIFQVTLTLSATDYHRVFSSVEQPVFVSITDVTHAPNQPYPRQQISMVPYAAKVPVDGVTVVFNDQGQLYAPPQVIDTGTDPGDLIRLDEKARLPALDGSLITKVSADSVGGLTAEAVAASAITVGRSTSENVPNTLVFRDAQGGFNAGRIQFASLALLSGRYTMSVLAPQGLENDVTYTLPAMPLTGKFLTTNASGALSWAAPDGFAAATVPASGIQGLTAKSIPFVAPDHAGLTEDPTKFVWDPTLYRLGVGTNGPLTTLDVRGDAAFSTSVTTPLVSLREVRFGGLTATGPGYLGLKAPENFPGTFVWTLPETDGVNGQILSTNGAGSLGWMELPKAPVTSVAGKLGDVYLNTGDVEEGPNLYFTQARVRQAIDAMPPLAYSASTGVFSLGQANSVGSGYLSSADWLFFSSKQGNLGYIPLNKAGDTMTGNLNMSGMNSVINLAPPVSAGDATSKSYVDNRLAVKVDLSSLGSLAYKDAITTTDLTDGTIINADISPSAAISDEKLATIESPGKVSGSAVTFGIITGTTGIDIAGNIQTAGTLTATGAINTNGSITAGAGITGVTLHATGGISSVNGFTTPGMLSAAGGVTTSSLTASGLLNATAGVSVTGAANVTGSLTAQGSVIGASGVTSGGPVTIRGATVGTNHLRFNDEDDTHYIGFKAPNTLTENLLWTLPSGEGQSGQVLSTDGVGALRWISQPLIPVTSVAGRTGNITLTSSDIEEGSRPYFTSERARNTLSATVPLTYNSATGLFGIPSANRTTDGYLSFSDWITFNAKQNALSYVPLNKAGDKMAGSIDMAGFKIKDVGTPTASDEAANKFYVDGQLDAKINAADVGALAFESFVTTNEITDGTIKDADISILYRSRLNLRKVVETAASYDYDPPHVTTFNTNPESGAS